MITLSTDCKYRYANIAQSNCFAVNLGTGNGYSVLEMVKAFERASNKEIRFSFAPRRDGDVAECYADTGQAQKLLDWKAERDLDAMCRDTWNWVCKNPSGYETSAA